MAEAERHDVGTNVLHKVVKNRLQLFRDGKLYVALQELRDYVGDVGFDKIDLMLNWLETRPIASRPVNCSISDEGYFVYQTTRFKGETTVFVYADAVRTFFPQLRVGDLESGSYWIEGKKTEWTTLEEARVRIPEFFPRGEVAHKLKKQDVVNAALGIDGVWRISSPTMANCVTFVNKAAIAFRLAMKQNNSSNPTGELIFNVEELRALLDKGDADKTKKRDLLKQAVDQGMLTAFEYDASMPQDMKTEKCYLYSQLTDPLSREAIDKLVIVGSKMLFAGSLMMNHVALRFPDLSFSSLVDQTFAKFLVFPWKGGDIPVEISGVFDTNAELVNLYPTTKEVTQLLTTVAIDNFVQLQGCKFSSTCKNHVRSNIIDRVKSYILGFLGDHGVTVTQTYIQTLEGRRFSRSLLWDWVLEDGTPLTGFPQAVYDEIDVLTRMRGGGSLKADLGYSIAYDIHRRITPYLNTKPGEKKRSVLPIFDIHRNHVRLDQRVLTGLCERYNIENNDMGTFLNLDGWRSRRKTLRKNLRKRSERGRLRKTGYGSLSSSIKDANIRPTSFETDGVALSVCWSWNKERAIEEDRSLPLLDKSVIGKYNPDETATAAVDPGRVQPITDAYIADDKGEGFQSSRITRSQYYRACLFDRRREMEVGYMESKPDLQQAYRDMADLGWKTMSVESLTAMTQAYINHQEQHDSERLDKRSRLLKMLLWRRKQSYQDQQADSMVTRWFASKKGAKQLIVFYGNGSFAPTGRREKAVPTKEWIKRLLQAMKRKKIPGGILMTGEYLTTQMCHKCGDLTKEVKVGNEVSRDLRCCRGACTEGHPNNCRVLNRDRNAAINIYKAGMAYIKGEERPRHLTKAGKEEYLANVALAAARPPQ